MTKIPQCHVIYDSNNDKGDNEMLAEAVHRSLAFTFTSQENPNKETVWWRLYVCYRLKGGPLPPYDIDRIAQDIREEYRRK